MSALIWSLFILGLSGSPHCLGMCGGVVAALGMSVKGDMRKKRQFLWLYHIGRLLSYALLGAVFGILGQGVLGQYAHSNLPRLIIGIAMILVALVVLGAPFLNTLERLGLRAWTALAPLRQKVLPIDTSAKAIGAGMLWGLLPCGLVYSALLLGFGMANTSYAMLGMVAFGLGTMPALLGLGGVFGRLNQAKLRKFNGTALLLAGLLIAISPIAMHALHGNHHGHHDHSHHHH